MIPTAEELFGPEPVHEAPSIPAAARPARSRTDRRPVATTPGSTRGAATTAAEGSRIDRGNTSPNSAWTDDSPVLLSPEFTSSDGDTFTLRILDGALTFELDRVRFERDDLHGTLTVRTTLAGARTHNGVLSMGSINLSSVDTRHRRAKQLADLARAPQIDFLHVLEGFACRVHDAVRNGDPAVDLRTITPTAADQISIDGITLYDKHPVFWFGDGGSGKSLLALYAGGELARRGLTVLFADWELSAEDHADRYARIFGVDAPSLLYARCARPMTAEVDRLRRLARQHDAAYLICDSVAFACDGRPEDAEVAARYFQCLRQIGIGSLSLAHVNKSDESDKKPFGSSFWHNGARATWNIKRSDTDDPRAITLGCYNRKANLGPLQPAVGFQIEFADTRTLIRSVDPAGVDDLAASLSLRQRIRNALSSAGPQTLASLAEQLGAKTDSIDKTVRRASAVFVRVSGEDGITRIAIAERRAS